MHTYFPATHIAHYLKMIISSYLSLCFARLVSGFQAVLATTTGTIVCTTCYDDVLHRSHPLTLIYAWFGLPYFFYDTISMFYVSTISDLKPKESYWKKFCRFVVKSPVIVVHHVVLAPVGFTLLLVRMKLLSPWKKKLMTFLIVEKFLCVTGTGYFLQQTLVVSGWWK